MWKMELPLELGAALEKQLATRSARDLAPVSDELSRRYREGHGRNQGTMRTFLRSQDEVLAYAAYRLPATYAAISAALIEVRARLSDWQPRTLLDVGAGPATATWAATELWPHLEQITLLEREAHMIALGKELAAGAASSAFRQADWQRTDLSTLPETAPVLHYDLVVCAYVLGELSPASQEALLNRLWQSAEVLVLVEPGTPRGFALIRSARDQLRAAEALTLAPCPHNQFCPMPENDWCHFAQRITRTRLQRHIKKGTLAYEDEKFSYVAMSRVAGLPIESRVIRHPQKRGGHVHLELCTTTGLRQTTVARSAREQYRIAQRLEWGDAVKEPLDRTAI
jgi:ribosomal protein RSM22 (predicted rRNA methylase)